ncbi:ABC-2 transporter permease [Oceanomicrobium pacificus]|uniref:Transport permease protein n=1 Tax=Oceanomicrobium pacificus TaxID=2692916 RepID=A0A6B0TW67_9RHOB|nr:hypothetical protein [Oceanomicrobium pacificus]MXU65985.1 hypothetical protein [Oceanomicrobium pacificus]
MSARAGELTRRPGGGALRWAAVVGFIAEREVRLRLSQGMVGYGWTFVVPLIWIGGLVLSFDYLGRAPTVLTDTASFVASGMIGYVVFRQTVTAMTRAPSHHRHVLGWEGIRAGDIFIAAALIEALNAMLLLGLIRGLLALYDPASAQIADVLGALNGLGLAWALGTGFGILAARTMGLSESARRLIPLALRPLFWISGIFFTAAELPARLLALFIWNPLLHVTEVLRSGYLEQYQTDIARPLFPLGVAGACLLIAALLPAPEDR